MTDVVRVPAVPALLDQHLTGEEVEVIIRARGREYYTKGTFREATWNTRVTEVTSGWHVTYVPTERHLHLHLVAVQWEVRDEV